MNHKITYLGLCLFAVLLWGCDKEQVEIEEPTPPQEVSRPVGLLVDGDLTKGVVITKKDSIRSLGLIAYSTDTPFDEKATTSNPNLFDNVSAMRTFDEKTLSSWSYTPAVYWPSNPDIKNTFFAYSPYQDQDEEEEEEDEDVFPEGSIRVVTDQGSPKLIYRVPQSMSEQIDLLYSEYNADVKNINYNEANNGNVKFNMKHALLWLRFIIAPVKESGHENEIYTIDEFNMTAGRIINTGQFDMATATWSKIDELPNDGYESVNYDFDNLMDEPLVVQADSLQPMGGVNYDHCLMIIPQAIVLSENLTAVTVAFTYYSGVGEETNIEHYITMPFPDVKLNKPGYVMTYIVKLSTTGARIEFQDSNPIDEWIENTKDREVEAF
ncbi:fimbrillin family protein [Parabacteroides sp. OttesenSCG-928-K15]|nr:fimbrillin family protein [Parabacteroides sp. OttesenSCG-928-K15]